MTKSSVEYEHPAKPVNPADLGAQTVINPEGRQTTQTTGKAEISDKKASNPASTALWQSLFPTEDSQNKPVEVEDHISLGRFEIEKRIGQGGMGAVFRARDTELNRIVALKVLSPQQTYDPSSVKRFRNEARAAAQLDHDRIARVYSIDHERGLTFIAFEYVEGWNVRELINRNGRLTISDAINYTLQIAGALQYTAASGVYHRDIKPSNIIVMPDGRAKLVDWGLARQESLSAEGQPDLTVSGTTLGTFDYISPEQAKDPRQVDARSDLYSLGCTMYHMVTGEAPYANGTVLQKLLDHQADSVPDPRDINPEIPPRVAQVIIKLMASRPEKRYQTPAELIRELLPIASNLGLQPTQIDRLIWHRSTGHHSQHAAVWNRWTWVKIASVILMSVFVVELSMELLMREFFPVDAVNLAALPAVVRHNSSQTEATVSSDSTSPGLENGIDPIISENISFPEVQPDNVMEAVPPLTDFTSKPLTIPPLQPSPLQDVMASVKQPGIEGVGTILGSQELPDWPAASLSGASIDPKLISQPDLSTSSSGQNLLKPGDKPFVIRFADARPTQRFETLDAAIENATTGSIIELEYDGLWTPPLRWESSIRIIDRQLTIRGAPGYSPTLHFRPINLGKNDYESQFLYVRGGSLDLINVNLVMKLPADQMVPEPALINAVNCEALRLKDVTMTILSSSSQQISAIRWSLTETERMNYQQPQQSIPQIEMEQVVVRGAGDLFVSNSPVPVNLELENCLIALTGSSFVQIAQEEPAAVSDLMTISLQHVTSINGAGLLHQVVQEYSPGLPMPVQITARNNIFSTLSPQAGLLNATVDYGVKANDFVGNFRWMGERNFFDRYEVFVDFKSPTVSEMLFDPWDYADWQMGLRTGSYERFSQSRIVLDLLNDLPLTQEPVSIYKFDLLDEFDNPARSSASDVRNAGADLQFLPQLPGVDQLEMTRVERQPVNPLN